MRIGTIGIDRFELTGSIELDFKSGVRLRAGIFRKIKMWIEHGNWDEQIVKMGKRIDLFCWATIIAIVICMLPMLIHVLA